MCLNFDSKTQSYEPAEKAVSKTASVGAADHVPILGYGLVLTVLLFNLM